MARVAPLAAVVLLLALPQAEAQEPPLPDGAVARVGEEPITKGEFDRLLRGATRGAYGQGAVLDPPRFERCVAADLRRPSGVKRRPSRRALRRHCERRYTRLRTEVLQFLVDAVWTRQEAAARGIAVTPGQVRRHLERQKRSVFADEREYRRFLRESGQSNADLLNQIELDLLRTRLRVRAIRSAPRVTEEEVDAYYAWHRREYRGIPRRRARRTIRQLLTAEREQRVLEEYVEDFNARYRAITVCAPDYVIPECGSLSS